MEKMTMNDLISFNNEATLITIGTKTALFDCGMAHRLPLDLIAEKLKGAPLDYIFLTHSHYDHVGALPYLKSRWPKCCVCGAGYAQYVLTRPGALATIRTYSEMAAEQEGIQLEDYSDDLMKIEVSLADRQIVDLGGVKVQAVELLGHTKCSMGYLIDDTILIASESTGYLNEFNQLIPTYLVSGIAALKSVSICRELAPKIVVPAHQSSFLMADHPDYWEQCRQAIREGQQLIIENHRNQKSDEQIFELLKERCWIGELRNSQPLFAFRANTSVMIQTTLAEADQIEDRRYEK